MSWLKFLSVILVISLAVNLWFVWQQFSDAPKQTQDYNKFDLAPSQTKSEMSLNDKTAVTKALSQHSTKASEKNSIANSVSVIDDTTALKQEEYFAYLEALLKNNQFELLEYETRNYLRQYPDDIDAMILEATAYYHTKPLNTALVQYYLLLTKNLNVEQADKVEKIIAVNTTRVIQQFSGDGAWELLATFLEPLVQVDPFNRSYLISLARAYGMQEQFTLMEDVLANFTPNDPRAQRVRDTVAARLGQTPSNDALEDKLARLDPIEEDPSREPDLSLNIEDQYFIADADLSNTRLRLLVDTGASTSAISEDKFSEIEPYQTQFLGQFFINTAGGSIQAPIYKIENLRLNSVWIQSANFIVLPSSNLQRFDGLLGMNILSYFDMDYDSANQTMKMYKKR